MVLQLQFQNITVQNFHINLAILFIFQLVVQ